MEYNGKSATFSFRTLCFRLVNLIRFCTYRMCILCVSRFSFTTVWVSVLWVSMLSVSKVNGSIVRFNAFSDRTVRVSIVTVKNVGVGEG